MITKVLTIEEEIDLIRKEEREEEREEGIEKGIEKGEYKKAIEGAREFLKMGMDAEKIAQGLGLPLDNVLQIKKELDKR